MPELKEINPSKIIGLAATKVFSNNVTEYFKIIDQLGDPSLILKRKTEILECPELITALNSKSLIDECEREIRNWEKRGIQILVYGEKDYPQKLKNIYQPPPIIFYRGNVDCFNSVQSHLSVVGTRRADGFGCELARTCSRYMANYSVCIVSGLAAGIDAAAHSGALDTSFSKPTIAVLGNGLNSCYPASNQKLFDRIISQGGLLVSQFEPDERPFPSNFLARNRIIAGLSEATLVIQAPERSGSLATARHALEEGRDVLVVPGAINDPRYGGSNKLIKNLGYVILAKEDLLEFYPHIDPKSFQDLSQNNEARNSESQLKIIKILQQNPRIHINELQDLSGQGSLIAQDLLQLEFANIIQRLPGSYFSLKLK